MVNDFQFTKKNFSHIKSYEKEALIFINLLDAPVVFKGDKKFNEARLSQNLSFEHFVEAPNKSKRANKDKVVLQRKYFIIELCLVSELLYGTLEKYFSFYSGNKSVLLSAINIILGKYKSSKSEDWLNAKGYIISLVESWIWYKVNDNTFDQSEVNKNNNFPLLLNSRRGNVTNNLEDYFYSAEYFAKWLEYLRDAELLSEKNVLMGKLTQNINLAGLMEYTLKIGGLVRSIVPKQMGKAISKFFGVDEFYKELQPKIRERALSNLQWEEIIKPPVKRS
jgi:hypothetical protein